MTRLRVSRFAGQARPEPLWQEAIAAAGMLVFFAAALFLAGVFGPPL